MVAPLQERHAAPQRRCPLTVGRLSLGSHALGAVADKPSDMSSQIARLLVQMTLCTLRYLHISLQAITANMPPRRHCGMSLGLRAAPDRV